MRIGIFPRRIAAAAIVALVAVSAATLPVACGEINRVL